ncbi:protein trichome birefringence-like 36 [Andrographis paniculata]|uniref:protein trichome birefringence-like 36 n=1 Tax=Andrographis paniculata TaxID=175694 RepID=UPI0021E7786E|nr:protein trichome birefringence-like 36 [Andrographis paniculata]
MAVAMTMTMAGLHPNKHLFLLILLVVTSLWFSYIESSSRYDQEELLQWLDGKDAAAAAAAAADDDDDEISMIQASHSSLRTCDFTKGKWVYDQTYPLYDATCPYLSTAVTCRKNGRPDSDYEKWRWKPDGCTIRRFDALEFLGKMRRKRMMLVGDSIMRNQWESLVCLVQSVIPTARKTVVYNGPTMAFLALDFEMSIEYCWAPFLVELRRGRDRERILNLDSIEENAKYWRGVDVLVFDSAHWWTHSDKWSSWDLVKEGNNLYRDINPAVAYEKGLMTWAKWIDLNLDPRRTKVFFRSMSPSHNRDHGWKCHNQSEPLEHLSRPRVPEQILILQKVFKRMQFPVYIQDITSLSALRQDGHPSVYARASSSAEKNNQKVKGHASDCSHWCLPGVPDAWNEMLSIML